MLNNTLPLLRHLFPKEQSRQSIEPAEPNRRLSVFSHWQECLAVVNRVLKKFSGLGFDEDAKNCGKFMNKLTHTLFRYVLIEVSGLHPGNWVIVLQQKLHIVHRCLLITRSQAGAD